MEVTVNVIALGVIWKGIISEVCMLDMEFLSFKVQMLYVKVDKWQRNNQSGPKQNRENTKGYSKSIVRENNDKFGKRIGLNE